MTCNALCTSIYFLRTCCPRRIICDIDTNKDMIMMLMLNHHHYHPWHPNQLHHAGATIGRLKIDFKN